MASSVVNEILILEPHIWKACAGSYVQIPTVDSRVYYFPQGHAERSTSPPDISCFISSKPFVFCRIVSVRLLANPNTDEVFAKIRLEPVDRFLDVIVHKSIAPVSLSPEGHDDEGDDEKVASFAKIVTASDVNNGGGFSVPRVCAESIFPPLNYEVVKPAQTISVRDVQGVVWEFRYVYRGTPRRHMLTTGWSKFVHHKNLIAGDSVVFMRNQSGNLYAGIRRTRKSSTIVNSGRWNGQIETGPKLEEVLGSGEGFSSSSRGRVSAESVVEAAELAGVDRPFEIVYYPKMGLPDFVVEANAVEKSLNTYWEAGMRIKMAVESEYSSRMTWFRGTISSAKVPDHGPWHGSPWRMLQVTWDEPDVSQNINRVSPWEVELSTGTPPLPTLLPPMKKFRVSRDTELMTDREGALFFPMRGLTNSMRGLLSPSLDNYNTSPVGIQGARHDSICVSSLANLLANNTHQKHSGHVYGIMAPKLSPVTPVSTELSIGRTSHLDNSSSPSKGNVHFLGTERIGNQNCNSITKSGGGSFQLFGKTIQTNPPVEAGLDDGGKGRKETEGVIKPLDTSLRCITGLMFNVKGPQL